MPKKTTLDSFVLNVCKRSLSLNNFTCDQIENIAKRPEVVGVDRHSFINIWLRYNTDPPKPPYDFLFETQDEAVSFAKKAKEKYDVNCEIDIVDFRKWKLKNGKK